MLYKIQLLSPRLLSSLLPPFPPPSYSLQGLHDTYKHSWQIISEICSPILLNLDEASDIVSK